MPVRNVSRSITVRVDSALRARLDDLDEHLAAQIRSYLTIANKPKVDAIRRGDWGADEMPDMIELWRHVGEELVMPRGFAHVLRAGAERLGYQIQWDDQTTAPVSLQAMAQMREINLRPDQEAAAQELIMHRQGVLQAPTGGGKTIVGLEIFRRLGLRGLVLVGNIGLAEQWRARARGHLGIDAGLIGDSTWEERSLTIALVQSLYRLATPQLAHLLHKIGILLVDEAHHAVAPTWRDVIERCPAAYRIGKTATPLDGDWRKPMLEALIGPVVHRMEAKVLEPTIQVIRTGFRWVPNASEQKLVDAKAIYRHIIKALEQDDERLNLIVRTIMSQPKECTELVVCKRLGYLEEIFMRLCRAGCLRDRIFFMRGSESRAERARIAEIADNGGCIILATVADEGVDIPRLDRIHLTWPARKVDPIIQQIGRILRDHPLKLPPVVIDYADTEVGMLRSQAYARMNNVYRSRSWKVEVQ